MKKYIALAVLLASSASFAQNASPGHTTRAKSPTTHSMTTSSKHKSPSVHAVKTGKAVGKSRAKSAPSAYSPSKKPNNLGETKNISNSSQR
jgi:hypothetical protein